MTGRRSHRKKGTVVCRCYRAKIVPFGKYHRFEGEGCQCDLESSNRRRSQEVIPGYLWRNRPRRELSGITKVRFTDARGWTKKKERKEN